MSQIEKVNPAEPIPDRLQIEHVLWQSGKLHIAGVDEAGRGPLAGPVVAAAVIFPPFQYIPEVRDSKTLSARQREALFELITRSALAFGIGIVPSDVIDRINIREATFRAMRQALGRLAVQPDYVLFDGYELPEKFFPQEAVINGDDLSFTIAAASIIAKVTRDRMMVELHQKYPQYHFDRHKGYGTKLHREMILKYGPSPVHRISFLKKILPSLKSR